MQTLQGANEEQVDAEQDNRIDAAAGAIVLHRPGAIKLGDLLAASPALEGVRMGLASAALDVAERIGRRALEGVASLALDAARAGIVSVSLDATEHYRRNLGISQGVSNLESLRGAAERDVIRAEQDNNIGAAGAALGGLYALPAFAGAFNLDDVLSSPAFAGISGGLDSLSLASGLTDSLAGISGLNSFDGLSGVRAWLDDNERCNKEAIAALQGYAAAEQQQRQEAMLAAFADVGRWQQPWTDMIPRQWEVYEPEPPAEQIEVVEIPSRDWREVITTMHYEGRLSPAELIDFALQLSGKAPGRKLPSWQEIEAIALAYRERGHKFDNQAAFAQSLYISREALQSYLRIYETKTGERLRPGRGRSKLKRIRHN